MQRSKSTPKAAPGPSLLAGSNPQVAMGGGDAPVQAYIAAMPGWKGDLGRRLDALVMQHVPQARKAVKWNSPFYGIEGQGWFVSFHTFTHYVKVTFFQGTSLRPAPAGGTAQDARWINVHEDGLDEVQMAAWLQQAAALPGWMTADIGPAQTKPAPAPAGAKKANKAKKSGPPEAAAAARLARG